MALTPWCFTMALHVPGCWALALLLLGTQAAPSLSGEEGKLVRTIRVRRQAPSDGPTSPSNNQTNKEQPMVFNHVYNINVPNESLCSVDLDSAVPPPSQATREAVSSWGGEGPTGVHRADSGRRQPGHLHPPHQHPQTGLCLSRSQHCAAAGHPHRDAGERGVAAQSPVQLWQLWL
ncbi:hypothetical protein J4Q44_G00187040 [Coregonus suidteri]|uniref:Uncharacterized protein n=1 Tax=Coregonus suidteri TaxID=861788 RepID=A0AAN8LJ11_9TELE